MKNSTINRIIVVLFFFFLFFSSNSDAQVLTPRYGISMIANSQGYYEYLPIGYSSGSQTYPLLILLHGLGELGNGSASQLPSLLQYGPEHMITQGVFPTSFTVNGKTFSFIIIVPQFINWPQPTDVDSIIDYAIQHYRVDISRVYLTGLSMGGGAVWDYAGNNLTYANRIAAIVPISGASYPDVYRSDTIATANLPVWATHNDSDQTVPSWYTIDYINYINSAPTPPNPLAYKTIFHSFSHDAWDSTYSIGFTRNGMNIYQWMLQFQRGGSIILPVTGLLLSLQKKANNSVLLTWKTYTENNIRGFEIERSSDGINFTSIGFVKSTGVGGNGSLYNYMDAFAFAGKDYYRLKIVDNNSNNTISPIKVIDLDNEATIKLYPNPVHNFINIRANHIFYNAQLRIVATDGQVVIKIPLNGNNNVLLSVNNLPRGIYSAEIIEDEVNTRLSFIKQ
jgi:predicted esterase